MSDVVIECKNLEKVFTNTWGNKKVNALKKISFSIKQGEIYGLLGPNGSGKSTTIKILLGLLFPTRGIVKVFDKSPKNIKNKHKIGYLPEENIIYPYLNSYETLDFYASLFSLPKSERVKRCNQLLEMVGLSHVKNRPVGTFSKGMARRLGLAQALINDPQLIFLDEPTSGLDPIACRDIKDLILLLKKRGKTIVLTSHLLADVEDVADNLSIFYGGVIQAQGSLKDLLINQNKNRIEFPSDSEAMTRIQSVLDEKFAKEEFKVANVTISLEEFFLNIVNKAQDKLETSGANQGEVASYLKEDTTEEATNVEDKISAMLKK